MTAASLAIAITTAPRRTETFTQSLASLRAAGFDGLVRVFADRVHPAADDRCMVLRNDPPLDGLKNWCHALRTLLTDTDADWLMVLEDDVTWAPGSAEALDRDLLELDPSDTGYLSLYLCRHVSKEIKREQLVRNLKPGIYATQMGSRCWGSQAYVLPRTSAERLLASHNFMKYAAIRKKNRDILVSGELLRMGLALRYRVPCLVNHDLGSANSSLSNKPVMPDLLTDYWTGRP